MALEPLRGHLLGGAIMAASYRYMGWGNEGALWEQAEVFSFPGDSLYIEEQCNSNSGAKLLRPDPVCPSDEDAGAHDTVSAAAANPFDRDFTAAVPALEEAIREHALTLFSGATSTRPSVSRVLDGSCDAERLASAVATLAELDRSVLCP